MTLQATSGTILSCMQNCEDLLSVSCETRPVPQQKRGICTIVLYSFECRHGAGGGAGGSSPPTVRNSMEIRGEKEGEEDEKKREEEE
jgi:hypothetical protein